jgi:peptidoglycan/xylan/chitin deacetylase (PgdA/CDA1 family)
MAKIQKARAAYSPIIDRKPLKLPNGARLGVWFRITFEKWNNEATMARTVLPAPQGVSVIPDIPNLSWFEYVADWVNDDQPYPLNVKSGKLIAVPYTVEVNDIVIYAVQHHSSPEIYNRACAAFDTLYEEGAESARFMGISMHPYVMGAAHRVKYIDKIIRYIKEQEGVLFMTGEEIVDWYNANAG